MCVFLSTEIKNGAKTSGLLCSETQVEIPGLMMLTSAFLPDLKEAQTNFTGVHKIAKISPIHKAAFE